MREISRVPSAITAVACLGLTSCGDGTPLANAVPSTPSGTAGTMVFVALDGTARHLYLMQVDAAGIGGSPRRLTADAQDETYPSWSPDGSRIAYQGDLDGSAIYVINADGSDEQRLSPTPGLDVTPSWSADGSKIIYARLYSAPQANVPSRTDIRIMNADGSDDHAILVDTVFSVEPRWSVRDQIVFMSLMSGADLEIFTMNSDGSNLRQLTTLAINGDPVWSPDGLHISFGSDREGGGKLNVFVMNADGSEPVQLTHFNVPDEAGDTNWSGDGKKIAFEYDVGGMQQSNPTALAEVWTMNADGSDPISSGVPAATSAARRAGSRSGFVHANADTRLPRYTVRTVDWRSELERLHPMSFAWALYCCRQRREEAQDVLQEVYLRVLDGRAQFAGQSSVKTWLFAVIRRTASDHDRRHWLRASLLERWLRPEPSSDPGSGPEAELGASQDDDRLRAALAGLSTRQQEVLHLVFYQDLTIEEAAGLLSISLGSARTHFERGKARLRERFGTGPVS